MDTLTSQNISLHIHEKTLMGPGPSDVPKRVLHALSQPTIGHLDPQFVFLMDEIKKLTQYAFRTNNRLTMVVSAPGSAGMETCFVNLVEPGDKVLVCINGVFGRRMKENVERCGGTAVVLEEEWGKPINPNKVEDTLKNIPGIQFVAFVHAETSTGAQSDAKEIAQIAHRHDAMVIVDAVTSLGGTPLEVDEWELDAVYSGSQKCLSCVPGLSPVTFNEHAQRKIQNRRTKVQSWFLDLNLVMDYWGSNGQQRSYHHTAPVNSLYAFYESLHILKEEGIENSWKRHRANHELLKKGLSERGIEFFVEEPYRLPQLNTVVIPDGVNDAETRRKCWQNFDLEIGGGLGPGAGSLWRIGLMGHSSREENVELCLKALDACL